MSPLIRNSIIALVCIVAVAGAYKALGPTRGAAPSGGHHDEAGHGAESVTMDDKKIAANGIKLDTAGPQVLRETLRVHGMLQPNQETTVQVTPRFPGVVRNVRVRVGDKVERDAVLAAIESNQSLTSYDMKSPVSGTVIDRQVTLGEYVSEQKPAFVVADLSSVWADFSVARRDLNRIKSGDRILLDPEDGGEAIETKITYLSPIGASDTQTALARAVVDNKNGRLRPGLFIGGRLLLGERPVPLAIKLSALQTIENRTVVFVRSGDKIEPRDVEIGARDSERAEILFGLMEGDVYVAKNSFIVKAELAKSSAAHEH